MWYKTLILKGNHEKVWEGTILKWKKCFPRSHLSKAASELPVLLFAHCCGNFKYTLTILHFVSFDLINDFRKVHNFSRWLCPLGLVFCISHEYHMDVTCISDTLKNVHLICMWHPCDTHVICKRPGPLSEFAKQNKTVQKALDKSGR